MNLIFLNGQFQVFQFYSQLFAQFVWKMKLCGLMIHVDILFADLVKQDLKLRNLAIIAVRRKIKLEDFTFKI